MTGSQNIAVDIVVDPHAIDDLVVEILHYLEGRRALSGRIAPAVLAR